MALSAQRVVIVLMKVRESIAIDIPDSDLKSSYQWWPEMHWAILRVSKSSYTDWRWCRRQYGIKRVLRVREPPTDDMTRGSNVHDAVDDFYANFDMKAALAAKSEGYGQVLSYFLKQIPDSNSERGMHELGEYEHLRRFMTVEARRFMDAETEHFLPSGNEVGLDAIVEIDGVMVHINGFVDRIFSDANGNLHIHELKTGAWKENKYKREAMRQEMAFYAYLIKHCEHPIFGGKDATFWGWDHTGGREIFRGRETVRVKEITSMYEGLREIVAKHKQYRGGTDISMFQTLPKEKIERLCTPWCRVKGFCSHFGEVLMYE